MENGAYTGIEDEVEIDLLDLFWELLMQWKPILVCMVLCGCLLMPAMYLKDMRRYRASVAASEELIKKVSGETDEESAEEMSSALEETEQKAVDNAVLSYRQLLDLQYVYDTTVRYHLDPKSLQALTLSYRLHADDAGQLSVLRDAYASCLGKMDAKKQIADAYGIASLDEAEQMVSVSGGDAASTIAGSTDITLKVVAYLVDDTDADAVSECIQSIIKSYKAEAGNMIGGHSVTLLSEEEEALRDTAIFSERADIESRIVGLESTINTTTAAFSDEQKQVYDYLTAKLDEEYGIEDADGEDKDEKAAVKDTAEQPDEASADEAADIDKPSMNPKYFLLGMLLGAFLYAGIYVVWWIISPRVRQSDEMAGWLGIRPLGEIRSYPAKSAAEKFFKDKWIYGIRYKNRLDTEGALATIRERIQLMPENANGLLFIQPTEMTDRQKEFVDRIVREAGRDITVVLPEEAASVAIEERLAEHPQVVLVSSAGKTPYKAVRRLYAGCRNYGADFYGHILIEAM